MNLPSIDRDKFYEAVNQTPTAEEPAEVAQFIKVFNDDDVFYIANLLFEYNFDLYISFVTRLTRTTEAEIEIAKDRINRFVELKRGTRIHIFTENKTFPVGFNIKNFAKAIWE